MPIASGGVSKEASTSVCTSARLRLRASHSASGVPSAVGAARVVVDHHAGAGQWPGGVHQAGLLEYVHRAGIDRDKNVGNDFLRRQQARHAVGALPLSLVLNMLARGEGRAEE